LDCALGRCGLGRINTKHVTAVSTDPCASRKMSSRENGQPCGHVRAVPEECRNGRFRAQTLGVQVRAADVVHCHSLRNEVPLDLADGGLLHVLQLASDDILAVELVVLAVDHGPRNSQGPKVRRERVVERGAKDEEVTAAVTAATRDVRDPANIWLLGAILAQMTAGAFARFAAPTHCKEGARLPGRIHGVQELARHDSAAIVRHR
jgi:hypothetical protein